MLRSACLVAVLGVAAATGLVDNPVAGDSLAYLDASAGLTWQAKAPSRGLSIPATVPGDIITDLQRAGVIGDPLYELNWLNSSIWDATVWEYSLSFTATAAQLAATETLLVFDGIKMGANVTLNGVALGTATDQFLRYEYAVRKLLGASCGLAVVLLLARLIKTPHAPQSLARTRMFFP